MGKGQVAEKVAELDHVSRVGVEPPPRLVRGKGGQLLLELLCLGALGDRPRQVARFAFQVTAVVVAARELELGDEVGRVGVREPLADLEGLGVGPSGVVGEAVLALPGAYIAMATSQSAQARTVTRRGGDQSFADLPRDAERVDGFGRPTRALTVVRLASLRLEFSRTFMGRGSPSRGSTDFRTPFPTRFPQGRRPDATERLR
jgi:hypothetical protein